MEQRFTSREVVDLTGITPRQLQWWDERGIVAPAREGHRRLYSLDDLAEVAVICELRSRGFSLQRVRKVMRFLQKEFGKRLVETVTTGSDYHLLADDSHIYVRTSAEQVIDVLKNSRQPMLAVCLSDTVRQVQAELRVIETPSPTPPETESRSSRQHESAPKPERRPVARAGQTPSAVDRRKAAQ
ncbi:MAG TPA: MerR family transcriptional regulator [Terriglobales bacterium]|nr:MerR family transcriptional regulator [Terriglobales bacterium]